MNPTAEEILAGTVWPSVMEALHKDIHKRFLNADPSDQDALRDVAHRARALTDIEKELRRRMSSTSINV